MSIQIGPLVLPVAPLVLFGFLLLTSLVATRISPRELRSGVDTAVWTSALVGLVLARLTHVLVHFDAYRGQMLSWPDIRDGGFIAWPGVIAGLLVLLWMLRRATKVRARVSALALGSALLWFGASSVLDQRGPSPQLALASIPTVLIELDRTVQGTPTPSDAASIQGAGGAPRALRLEQIAQQGGQRPMVVNLWATWCAPCRAEMPVFAKAQRERPDIDFVFVNQGEASPVILAYLQREQLDLKGLWRDPASALGVAVGSSGLPTTLIFDAQGRLVKKHLGVLNEPALKIALTRLGSSR